MKVVKKVESIKIDDYEKGILINERDDTVCVEMAYPRLNKIKHIEVGICDVRASDGIRIHYDFDRDGYVIEQPYIVEVDKGSYIDCVEHWKETAFVQSWALEDLNEELNSQRKK